MTQTSNSGLVAGKSAASSSKTVSIRVLRSFLYAGKPTTVGETLDDVPLTLALELVQMAKAERVEPGESGSAADREVVRDEAAATKRDKATARHDRAEEK